jgi:hypothetical protein
MEKTPLLLQQQSNKPHKTDQTKNKTHSTTKKEIVHTKQINNSQKENSTFQDIYYV